MTDRIFIDTNILIYTYSDEEEKREKAIKIIKDNENKDFIISLQVVNEFINTLKKKFDKSPAEIRNALEEIESAFTIRDLSLDLIKDAVRISERYLLSYYDSLIISAALASNCSTLYTEDLHHSQTIDDKLKILNPF
jgi:predicted nucleic acid-binding protein